jgi:hypothetical protein
LNTAQIPFAEQLKRVVATLCDTDIETQLTHSGKNMISPVLGKSYGTLQQLVGTGLRLAVDPDIWVKIALSRATVFDVLIIPDVRFKNEAQSIVDHPEGMLIRMEGDPAWVRERSTRDLNHISETDLDDWEKWDLIIHNDLSLNVLYSTLEKI